MAPSIMGYNLASGTAPSAQCRLYRRSWMGMMSIAIQMPICLSDVYMYGGRSRVCCVLTMMDTKLTPVMPIFQPLISSKAMGNLHISLSPIVLAVLGVDKDQ